MFTKIVKPIKDSEGYIVKTTITYSFMFIPFYIKTYICHEKTKDVYVYGF